MRFKLMLAILLVAAAILLTWFSIEGPEATDANDFLTTTSIADSLNNRDHFAIS